MMIYFIGFSGDFSPQNPILRQLGEGREYLVDGHGVMIALFAISLF